MISGFVNAKLLPMVPVSLKKLDGGWQELDVLLDTGSEYRFMLAETTATHHDIAIRLDCNSPASIVSVQHLGNSISMSPCWVELQLEGYPKVVEVRIIKSGVVSGVIGPSLLLHRRITIDVEENGVVAIDDIPEPTHLARIRTLIRKPKRQRPSLEYVWKLPWVEVAIKDSSGRYQTIRANVDTGDTGQLSLPPSYVERFGLRLPSKCQVITPDGPLDANCGDAEILWRGKSHTVKCIQRQEKNPPLIGMKLLSGNRITIDIDVDYIPPAVRIAPIPRSALSNKNLFQSLAERLRHGFAGRSWWR